ncbi:MAG: 16S rRNA (adenine(1518)-N(6)/adenine(1519)-N(6))-dimethyltransferase RsmA [Methanocorpusculum sp.]|nr:16S rRNA (adenine(1518)-N(6)/adenine(1519)-N(6))-dimethyltransferase RsmA [Methanocorpusculum sp.]
MRAPKDQHFLIDDCAVCSIADAVPVRGRKVLEIGPGGGVLTAALLERGAFVRAVELDAGLLPHLERRFSDALADGRLTITLGDASKVALPAFDLVVANLPYSISSKITFRLLDEGFESAVLMYQLEFAKRLAAAPGNGDYGRLSVMTQAMADVEFLLSLPPESFNPPPDVWSAVVKLTPRAPPVPIASQEVFANLVRELFSHRRKTIANGLKGLAQFYDKEALARFTAGLPAELLRSRAEMLSVAEFIELSNSLAVLV